MGEQRRYYPPETQAAVMAALLAGQSVTEVAREYRIPPSTAAGWKKRALEEVAGAPIANVATQKRELIGELLIEYLATTLKTLAVQAEFFGDREWLRSQSASELAILHGVATDKAIRLLEAMAAADGAHQGI